MGSEWEIGGENAHALDFLKRVIGPIVNRKVILTDLGSNLEICGEIVQCFWGAAVKENPDLALDCKPTNFFYRSKSVSFIA